MVGPRGFEPLTFCTPSKRATSLRYGPKKIESPVKVRCEPELGSPSLQPNSCKLSIGLLTVKERIKD